MSAQLQICDGMAIPRPATRSTRPPSCLPKVSIDSPTKANVGAGSGRPYSERVRARIVPQKSTRTTSLLRRPIFTPQK